MSGYGFRDLWTALNVAKLTRCEASRTLPLHQQPHAQALKLSRKRAGHTNHKTEKSMLGFCTFGAYPSIIPVPILQRSALYSCPNPTVSSTAMVSFWFSASYVLYPGRSRRLKLCRVSESIPNVPVRKKESVSKRTKYDSWAIDSALPPSQS
jgi:hypothetical protein